MSTNENLNKSIILKSLQSQSEQIKPFGVKRLALFGSFLREDFDSESDIDILVEFYKKTFDNYMDLKFFLEDFFHHKVDLVIADSLKPELKDIILREAVYVEGI